MADQADGQLAGGAISSERLQRVTLAAAAWTAQLVDLGGRNTLLYFKDLRAGTLDLRSAGASETAVWRLLSSHQIRLGDVFDEEARPAAAKRARTVRAKATENFEERGLQTLFLAWGMATWTNHTGTGVPAAPVLLRQASLAGRGGAGEDFDLALPGEFEINPTLVHLLKTEFKVDVTAEQLLGLLEEGDGAPDANPVFDRLRKLSGEVPGFAVADRVVLGNFSYAKLPMVNDIEAALVGGELASNDLLAAIAGDAGALEALRLRHPRVAADEPDRTAPSDEFLVLDADASQSFAINTGVHGGDLVVEGPPGTGKSQTIANLIATLAARGKRTLFVAEKRAAIDAVLERLNGLGLGDLVLDLHDGVSSRKRIAQDLAKALASAGSVGLTDHSVSHARLERRRDALRGWRDALHGRRQPWDLSVYEIQAELIALRRSEATAVRLNREVLAALGGAEFRTAAVELERFVDLGGSALLRGSSPWAPAFEGRLVVSGGQVQEARDAVTALAQRTLPQARAELHRVAEECRLQPPASMADGAQLLDLVEDVARTLARYDASIYDEAEELAALTAPGERGAFGRAAASLSNSAYRRARKRVTELAAGRKDPAAGVHADMVAAAEQRRRWARVALAPGAPAVPDGVQSARGLHTQLSAELRVVAERTGDRHLSGVGDVELEDRLGALLRDQTTLVKLPELDGLGLSLTNKGLWPLLYDVAHRGLDADGAGQAFRHVWLESILEHVSLTDPVVGGFDRETHERTVRDFRAADVVHLEETPIRVRRAVAERVMQARDDHPQQSQLVQAEASRKQRHQPIRQLVHAAPDVLTALKPCWAMSPLVVAQVLPPERLFDVVIFDEASQVTPADAVGALLRADRAIVAGDSKQLPPTSFFAAASGGGVDDEALEEEIEEAVDAGIALTSDIESVLDVMRALLPVPIGTKTLRWHYRSRDERLIAFSNAQESLYDWSLTTFPGTGVEDCVRHQLVPWVPGRVGQEASVSDEVERVVELIVEHAEQRPDESIGVIAMGIKHANRITERLRQVRVDRPDLDAVFEHGPPGRARPEPLFIKNLERVQGDERDAVILTIGYGKSADGRMLYRFGPLNLQGGERRLNVAITRARSRITLVSSFSSSDLDSNKLRAEGAKMLSRYLQYAESGGKHLGDQAMSKPELNPFERDVRDALTAAGIPLVSQYGCSGYWIDFAAQHPTEPGRMVLAIEADGATYHSGDTARDRDRLRQDHLERLGWKFHRIWSTDWFHHRESEIERAVAAWKAAVQVTRGRSEPLRAPGRPPPPPVIEAPPVAAPAEPAQAPRLASKPRFRPGGLINEYAPQTLRDLAAWIESDTLLRTEAEVLSEMMQELRFKRRGKNIVDALQQAIRDARSARRT